MNIKKDEIINWLKAYCDKFILIVVLAGILLSLSILIYSAMREKKTLAGDQRNYMPLVQSKQKSRDIVSAFDAVEAAAFPFQLGGWTTRMVVAELRVSCVKCGQPIPISAEVCPFKNCGAPQPKITSAEERDSDFDGIPDEWEKKYGLDPNMDDAGQDPDLDGFTNLEEFTLHTHPKDAASAPPPVTKLRVLKTGKIPFPLILNGVMQFSPDDRVFMIRNRNTGRDYSARIGETVDGYELTGYEKKVKKISRGTYEIEEDASLLTVTKDGKKVTLAVGDTTAAQGEPRAQLLYLADNSRMLAKKGDIIMLKNCKYKVIDINKQNVIVADMQSGSEITLEPIDELTE